MLVSLKINETKSFSVVLICNRHVVENLRFPLYILKEGNLQVRFQLTVWTQCLRMQSNQNFTIKKYFCCGLEFQGLILDSIWSAGNSGNKSKPSYFWEKMLGTWKSIIEDYPAKLAVSFFVLSNIFYIYISEIVMIKALAFILYKLRSQAKSNA